MKTVAVSGAAAVLSIAFGLCAGVACAQSAPAQAAADAKRKVRVLEWCHQPADHPVLLTMPESEYLRGYVVRVE